MTEIKEPEAGTKYTKYLQLRAQKTKRQAKGYHRPTIEAALEAGDIQGVIDKLTLLQRRFSEEYLKDYNATEAYVRAGGQAKYPNRAGWQMLQNSAVKACIDSMTLQRAGESTLKPDYVINKIRRTLEKAEQDGNHNATLRACELLARTLGMFIDRQEISGPNGDAIQLKQVKDAADAFTSAIAGLVERGGEGNVLKFPNRQREGGA